MTRQEVLFEQRLRLALTIVYLCLATANIVLMLKEKKAAEQKPAEAVGKVTSVCLKVGKYAIKI